MADLKKKLTGLLLAASFAVSLTACLRAEVSQPGETSGVGRFPDGESPDTSEHIIQPETGIPGGSEPETGSSYSPPPLDNRPENQTGNGVGKDSIQSGGTTGTAAGGTGGEISYKIENGRYVYSFPSPDRSRMNNTSWLNSVSRALFPDQGDDASGSWYFGKVTRDLNTGEVTYVWDRWDETLELLDKYGGIYRQNTDEKVCYLTFDCGYENGYTDPVLDVLKAKNVPGIFFVTGQYVDTAGDQIRRMIDEGHIIGNHTEHHYNATGITPETFKEEIESVERKMKELYGYTQPMLYWRPPQGGCNEYVLSMSEAMGLHTVLWSYAHYDYDTENQPDYDTALRKAKEGLHPGCVYLFHTVSKTNSEILGEFIDWIRAQGYEIRPICG